ncbi:MAG TPA: hypothetical protein PLJ47_17935 [Candidatus Hydrogenedentes bacterium]|nr:hypothetical protein [Candidatus Hydrogenedentota bacterium]
MKSSYVSSIKKRTAKTVLNVIAFKKKSFDSLADRVGDLQARADKAVLRRVESAAWMPQEGKMLVAEWLHTLKRGRTDLRKSVALTLDLSSKFVERVTEPVAKTKKRRTVSRKKKAVARVATA